MTKQIEQVLREHFKPEFLNRVDEIITFNRLEKEQVIKIVDIQLDILQKRLKDMEIELKVSSRVKGILAEEDLILSLAQGLLKGLLRQVQDPLALQILEGKIKEKIRYM